MKSTGFGWTLKWGQWVSLILLQASQHCISISVWREWWNPFGCGCGWKEWRWPIVAGHSSLNVYIHQRHHVLKTHPCELRITTASFSIQTQMCASIVFAKKEKEKICHKVIVFIENSQPKTQFQRKVLLVFKIKVHNAANWIGHMIFLCYFTEGCWGSKESLIFLMSSIFSVEKTLDIFSFNSQHYIFSCALFCIIWCPCPNTFYALCFNPF